VGRALRARGAAHLTHRSRSHAEGRLAAEGGDALSLSGDGRFAAVGLEREGVSPPASDIWIYDLIQGTSSRLASDGQINNKPTWSPDCGFHAS
jgi:hypothetical protein